jgi:tetratricopeptide (TPR) repeat protein
VFNRLREIGPGGLAWSRSTWCACKRRSTDRAALKGYTRERVPLDWAATQNNLGTALWKLGERESGTAHLTEAVSTYRPALEVWTREGVPLNWALAQNNLGNALAELGKRENGTAHLTEAVSAYRAALDEYTRERVPLDWAVTQNNLGTALEALGERESQAGRLKEAVAVYAELVETCRWLYASAESNGSKSQLAGALGSLSFVLLLNRRAGDALAAAQEALSLDPAPLWVETNRAHALLFLGRSEESKAVYVEFRDRLLFEHKTFAQAVTEDFSEFRKYGIDTPEMKDIDALLSPTQEKH